MSGPWAVCQPKETGHSRAAASTVDSEMVVMGIAYSSGATDKFLGFRNS